MTGNGPSECPSCANWRAVAEQYKQGLVDLKASQAQYTLEMKLLLAEILDAQNKCGWTVDLIHRIEKYLTGPVAQPAEAKDLKSFK